MPKLTDKFIKATKGSGKDQFFCDGGGLYLRITPVGSRVWAYRYKDNSGSTRWLDVGTYPSKSLAEARADAAALKIQRRAGLDPVEERQRRQQLDLEARASEAARVAALSSRMTVSDLFERWLRLEICNRKDGGKEMSRLFKKDILPHIGSMAVEDVRKRNVAAIVDDVVARGGNGRMGALVLAAMRQMFRYAVERDFIDGDPTATINKVLTRTENYPVIAGTAR